MQKKFLNEMFENLLHIGNKTNFWNANMKPYIYGSVNGIHVINLVKTVNKLEEMKKEIENVTSEGKKILFVATKLQAKDAISTLATETGNYYVSDKWVPGLLTNFGTIKRRISTYLKLLKDKETGGFDMLTKKEKAAKLLELEKLDKAYRGVKEMKKVPEVVFVIDSIYEAQAVREANSLGLTVFSIMNTNGDDRVVDYFVPANTNAVKSIEFLAEQMKASLKVQKKAKVGNTAKVRKTTEKPKVTVKKAVNKKADEAPKKEEGKEEKKAPVKKAATKKTPAKKETEKPETTEK